MITTNKLALIVFLSQYLRSKNK